MTCCSYIRLCAADQSETHWTSTASGHQWSGYDIPKAAGITESKLHGTWQQQQNAWGCSIRHLRSLHTWSCRFVHNFGIDVHNISSFGVWVQLPDYTGISKKSNNPIGTKINMSGIVGNFFIIFTVFTEEESGYISCKFLCNISLHSDIIHIWT